MWHCATVNYIPGKRILYFNVSSTNAMSDNGKSEQQYRRQKKARGKGRKKRRGMINIDYRRTLVNVSKKLK